MTSTIAYAAIAAVRASKACYTPDTTHNTSVPYVRRNTQQHKRATCQTQDTLHNTQDTLHNTQHTPRAPKTYNIPVKIKRRGA